MPKRLLLHIGLPKTGTTAIQRAFAGSGDLLRQHGIYYPRSEGGPAAQFLHRAALTPNATRRMRPALQDFKDSLEAEIAALPASIHTVVLSSEQCSLFLRTPAQIEALHAMLAPWFETIQVVIYLRRQDAHAASLYGQMLRRGMIAAPILSEIAAELNGLYDYETLLQDWGKAFGPGTVTPRIFERASLPNGDVVEDFRALCGITRAAQATAQKKPDINPSISPQGQALLRALGTKLKARGDTRQINDPIWPRLATLVSGACPGQGWQPDRPQATTFLATYQASNEAVRQKFFPARKHLFNPDLTHLPDQPEPEDPTLTNAAAAVILALLEQAHSPVARGARRRERGLFGGRRERKAGAPPLDPAGDKSPDPTPYTNGPKC